MVEHGQPLPRLGHGVLPQPGPGAVRRPSAEGQGGVEHPLASQLQLQIGGLHHHGEVGFLQPREGVQCRLQAVVGGGALLLVVEHADHIEWSVRHLGVVEQVGHHRQTRLHVGCPHPVDPSVGDVGGRLTLVGNGVEMTHQQHQRTFAGRAHHEVVAVAGDRPVRPPGGEVVGQILLIAGDRTDVDQLDQGVGQGHTGTSWVRSASSSEVFSSVDAVRWPMMRAQGTS